MMNLIKIARVVVPAIFLGVGVPGFTAPTVAQSLESPAALFSEGLTQVSSEPNWVTPGQGIGQITLGQTVEFVKSILGEPKISRSFEEEKQQYLDVGRSVDNELVFNRGFDLALEYSKAQNSSTYPIFKVYFKENRVIQIHLSIYMYDEEVAQNARLNHSELGLFSDQATMESVLGKNYVFHQDKLGFENYEYLDQGISFLFEDQEIVTIVLYTPLTQQESDSFLPLNKSLKHQI